MKKATAWDYLNNRQGHIPMQLQKFAADEPAEPGQDDNGDGGKTYTQEEVDSLLQKEGDRRVTDAQKKFEAKLQEEVKKASDEAERLAKLSAKEKEEERARAEREELEKARVDLQRERLSLEAEKQLAEKGLPTSFVAFLVAGDAEATKANIDDFAERFSKAVQDAVEAKMMSNAPAAGGSAPKFTNEEINKIADPVERIKARRELSLKRG